MHSGGRKNTSHTKKGRGLSARLKESPRPVVMVAKQRAARRGEKAALSEKGLGGGRRPGDGCPDTYPDTYPTAVPQLHPRGRGRGRASSKRPKKVLLQPLPQGKDRTIPVVGAAWERTLRKSAPARPKRVMLSKRPRPRELDPGWSNKGGADSGNSGAIRPGLGAGCWIGPSGNSFTRLWANKLLCSDQPYGLSPPKPAGDAARPSDGPAQ
jgi:hypothetical protein